MSTEDTEAKPAPDTTNEYLLTVGKYSDNHTSAMRGRAAWVRQRRTVVPTFHTRQEAYRFAAWLVTLADVLPDEDGAHTFEEVREAIQST